MKKLAQWAGRYGSPYPMRCVRLLAFPALVAIALPLLGLMLALLTAAGAMAAEGAIDVGGIYAAWQPTIVAIVAPVAALIVGWLAELVRRKFNLDIEARHREAAQTAITNAAGLALNNLGNSLAGKTVDVKSPAVAAAVDYVLKAAPQAMAKFGLGPDEIAEKIVAKLPQVANTTTPAAAPKAAG